MMKLFKTPLKSSNGSPDIKSIGTVIGSDAVFRGTLETHNSICVEGQFYGRMTSKGGVLINANATILADIFADYVVVHGKVTGNISALTQLDIGPTGMVSGDVVAPAVTIAKGGVLDGFCRMTAPDPKKLEPAASVDAEELDEPSRNGAAASAVGVESEAVESTDDIIVPVESEDSLAEAAAQRIHIIQGAAPSHSPES